MEKLATQTELSDSVFLTTILQYAAYIILAVACFQLFRVVILTIVTALRTLVRIVLLVISWPIYLILLPARALVFFTKLMVKLMLYVAVAAILYRLLGGPQNSQMIKETFGEVLQYVQATFLRSHDEICNM